MKRKSNSEVKAIFTDYFNGQSNMMTPDCYSWGFISRYMNRHLIWELSKGKGFSNDTIYGITVLEINDAGNVTRKPAGLSMGGFRSELEAIVYKETLHTIDIGKARET